MNKEETISKDKLMSLFRLDHRMSFGRGTTTSISDIKYMGGRRELLNQLSLSADFNESMNNFSQEDAMHNPKSQSAKLIDRRVKSFGPKERQPKIIRKDRSKVLYCILFISVFYCMGRWRESWWLGFIEATFILLYFMRNNLANK